MLNNIAKGAVALGVMAITYAVGRIHGDNKATKHNTKIMTEGFDKIRAAALEEYVRYNTELLKVYYEDLNQEELKEREAYLKEKMKECIAAHDAASLLEQSFVNGANS